MSPLLSFIHHRISECQVIKQIKISVAALLAQLGAWGCQMLAVHSVFFTAWRVRQTGIMKGPDTSRTSRPSTLSTGGP